jgi:hypothetical protein
MKKNILIIGIDPDYLDFSSNEFAAFPGISAQKIRAGLNGSAKQLIELGHHAEICWIDLGKKAQQQVQKTLQEKVFHVVMIGAGIRIPESNFLLFEHLVNTVHEFAPAAKFAFNINPQDTTTAIQRWI